MARIGVLVALLALALVTFFMAGYRQGQSSLELVCAENHTPPMRASARIIYQVSQNKFISCWAVSK